MTRTFNAEPFALEFSPANTALVIIDMQRDFVEPGGFGEALGNDVSLVRSAIEPCGKVLKAARDAGIMIIHTREGHRADLSDCPQRNSLVVDKHLLVKKALKVAFLFEVKKVTILSLSYTQLQVSQ